MTTSTRRNPLAFVEAEIDELKANHLYRPLRVMSALARHGARIAFHDPFVAAVTIDGKKLARTELTARAVAGADLVALLTPHRSYDLDWLAATAGLLFDARNAFGPEDRPNLIRL